MAYVSTEKAREVRNELKEAFPTKDGWKFSVRKYHSSELIIAILRAPVDFEIEHESLNHHSLDWYKFTPILEEIYSIANKGNYNKSDYTSDYHNVGFYLSMEIGQWNRPFEFVDNGKGQAYADKYAALKAEQEQIEEIERAAAEYEAEVEREAYVAEYGPQTNVDEVDFSNVQPIEIEPYQDEALFPKYNKNNWITEYKEQIPTGNYNKETVEVRAVVALSPKQYEAFSFRLMDYFEWVKPYGGSFSNAEFSTDDSMKFTPADWELFRQTAVTIVLKVMNVATGEFFYSNSERHNYARYIGFAKK
ncbi:MAG: LPD29 domain-containing protein [Thiotrichales bacterium]